MEKALLLEAIVNSASQGILAVDAAGIILFANHAAGAMFGYPTEELVGANLEMLLPDGARQHHRRYLVDFCAAPAARPMGIGLDLAGKRKDGALFPVEISLSHTKRVTGETVGIALISDISRRKELEGQLARSQKMDVVGRMAGGIAHDFNNMLTIILGYNRLMMKQAPTEALRNYAQEVDRAAERAAALTRRLLTFSRQSQVQRDVADLNALVAESASLLRAVTGEHIQIVTRPASDLGMVVVDLEQMHQVLANLVINSRDAMPLGGVVTIETANVELSGEYIRSHLGVQPGPYVMLSVSDTGTGMTAEVRERIFDPFFTTKERGKGTGLGLTTVWATVKNFGGDIWVYSEPGRGTTFKIYLPRVTSDGQRLPPGSPGPRPTGTETVLVVEDEEGVRNLTARMLADSGFDVLEAASPLEALRLSDTVDGDIHLLLTDVVMPQMTGIELADQMRRMRPRIRVLFMSGYAETSGQSFSENPTLKGLLLEKPFTPDGLVAKVKDALERPDTLQARRFGV